MMSAIYFHNQGQEKAKLRGSERAYMGVMINNLTLAALDNMMGRYTAGVPPIAKFLPEQIQLAPGTPGFADRFKMWFGVYGSSLMLAGRSVDTWQIALNTATL